MWQSFRFHSITQVKYSILPIYCTVFKFQVFLLYRFKFLLFFPTKTGKVGRRAEKVKGGSKITLTSSWSKQDCKSHLLSSKSRLVTLATLHSKAEEFDQLFIIQSQLSLWEKLLQRSLLPPIQYLGESSMFRIFSFILVMHQPLML